MMRCPTPNPVTLSLLQVWLLWVLVVRQAGAAFQLPPFLQTLSEQTLSKSPGNGPERVFSLPSSLQNVPNHRRFTPRKKHLKPHKLMKRMRKDWDPFWMSVERPKDADQDVVKEAPTDPTLVKALDRLNFTLRGSDDVTQEMEMDVQHVLRLWLLQHSTCHVRYSWDDLGILYWPRWVRHGFCQASDSPISSSSSASSLNFLQSSPSLSTSCSWPPGMHCVPSESRRIRILRWQCRHNRAFRNWSRRYRKPKAGKGKGRSGRQKRAAQSARKQTERGVREDESNDTERWRRKPFRQRRRKLSMRCKWKKIPYPVTDDCFCSC